MRLEIESKIELMSGAEEVVDLVAQKLEKRTLGTSRIKESHWSGGDIQGFALFSHGPLFCQFSMSRRVILEACWGSLRPGEAPARPVRDLGGGHARPVRDVGGGRAWICRPLRGF